MKQTKAFEFASMGTQWKITIWNDITTGKLEKLHSQIFAAADRYDHTYSRFIKDSLIWQLAKQTGKVAIPPELMQMLQLYLQVYPLTEEKVNPLIGFTISDLGYDETYSLHTKDHIRTTPNLAATIKIIDAKHIEITEPVLIDLGAMGKGYFVDKIAKILYQENVQHFLVDGSGDIFYEPGTSNELITVGLEHPGDTSMVIGALPLAKGAVCASAGNRRQWGKYHHIIDATTNESPSEVIATWVKADNAAVADLLATCLFFVAPENLQAQFKFEYCVLNSAYQVKSSAGFTAELF